MRGRTHVGRRSDGIQCWNIRLGIGIQLHSVFSGDTLGHNTPLTLVPLAKRTNSFSSFVRPPSPYPRFCMRRPIVYLAICILFSMSAFEAKAAKLVGGTGSNSVPGFQFSLVSVNPTTGQLAQITPANSIHFFTGLDVAPDHTLYGVGSDLFRIDPASGAVTDIGPLRLNGGSPILMTAMAFSPTGKLFTVDNNVTTLFTVDLNTGALTSIGSVSLIRGLAFTPDGSLYGGFANLFKIDPTNAHILADLGRYGDSQTYVGELDYYNGSLRGVEPYEGTNSAPKSTLYSINLAGVPGQLATKLTDINYDVVSIATVPEPSTLSLAAFGFTGLAAWSWRRKQSRTVC